MAIQRFDPNHRTSLLGYCDWKSSKMWFACSVIPVPIIICLNGQVVREASRPARKKWRKTLVPLTATDLFPSWSTALAIQLITPQISSCRLPSSTPTQQILGIDYQSVGCSLSRLHLWLWLGRVTVAVLCLAALIVSGICEHKYLLSKVANLFPSIKQAPRSHTIGLTFDSCRHGK